MSSPLNSTADIMYYAGLVNTNGAGMVNPELFYSKQLLDTIRYDANQYMYYRYAEEEPTQDKADKLVLRRWSPLQAHTVPLTEGVPPMSDKGSVEKYEIQADQYGRYMEFTDKVDFKVVDPVVANYTKEYSIVAIETLDLLAQKAMLTVAQKYYAGMAANQGALRPWSKPTIADLRLIGLALKKALVKPRSNGRYHVLCSPEFIYDMLDDTYVQKYMTINQTTKNLFDEGSAMIPLFGFEFYEVVNCPTSCTYKKSDNKYYFIQYKIVTSAAAASSGYTLANNGTTYIEYKEVEVTSAQAAIAAGYVNDSRTGKAASYIPAHTDYDAGALANVDTGYSVLKSQSTIILGKDALKRTGVAGEGNAKMYVKPLGSTGVLDPINQRQSIGFKINSVGFGSARTEAIVAYFNVPTQLNV